MSIWLTRSRSHAGARRCRGAARQRSDGRRARGDACRGLCVVLEKYASDWPQDQRNVHYHIGHVHRAMQRQIPGGRTTAGMFTAQEIRKRYAIG